MESIHGHFAGLEETHRDVRENRFGTAPKFLKFVRRCTELLDGCIINHAAHLLEVFGHGLEVAPERDQQLRAAFAENQVEGILQRRARSVGVLQLFGDLRKHLLRRHRFEVFHADAQLVESVGQHFARHLRRETVLEFAGRQHHLADGFERRLAVAAGLLECVVELLNEASGHAKLCAEITNTRCPICRLLRFGNQHRTTNCCGKSAGHA